MKWKKTKTQKEPLTVNGDFPHSVSLSLRDLNEPNGSVPDLRRFPEHIFDPAIDACGVSIWDLAKL